MTGGSLAIAVVFLNSGLLFNNTQPAKENMKQFSTRCVRRIFIDVWWSVYYRKVVFTNTPWLNNKHWTFLPWILFKMNANYSNYWTHTELISVFYPLFFMCKTCDFTYSMEWEWDYLIPINCCGDNDPPPSVNTWKLHTWSVYPTITRLHTRCQSHGQLLTRFWRGNTFCSAKPFKHVYLYVEGKVFPCTRWRVVLHVLSLVWSCWICVCYEGKTGSFSMVKNAPSRKKIWCHVG